MKKRFIELGNEFIFFGKCKRLEKITVKCEKCFNDFQMGKYTDFKNDEININYEFTYCPHCANKLLESESE